MHYQSLYRRFRPQRFGDVLGQEHVSETLRKAVAADKVAHAYLFSGPRGCGKTTSARILAKALNCTALVDGEPCGTCDSCVQVASGASMDVNELDAASNNGVDAMRDLVSRAALGTAGRRKVYIVDEVHMLSTAASNALLKTLEEPPDHVVFVLATTDPQKVLPTIRSRTQHFEFRLFPFPTLLELVRGVAVEAGIELDDATLEAVARRGNGSARDALSALDQVAAAGTAFDGFDVSELAEALGARDSAAVLVAVDRAVEIGRDPRQLARDLIDVVRSVFLAHMGRPSSADPSLVRALSPAGATRALEAIGEALIDIRDSLDPRVVLEVALVRLCRPELDSSIASLTERIDRLERREASAPAPAHAVLGTAPVLASPAPAAPVAGAGPAVEPARTDPAAAAAPTDAAAPAPEMAPPSTPTATRLPPLRAPEPETAAPTAVRRGGAADEARARLGLSGSSRGAAPSRLGSSPTAPAPAAPAAPPPAAAGRTAPPATAAPVAPPASNDPQDAILDAVSRRARMFLAAGRFATLEGDALTYVLPNPMHLERAREFAAELQSVTATVLGRPVTVALSAGAEYVSDDPLAPPAGAAPARPASSPTPAAAHHDDEEAIDLDELVDAPVDSGPSVLDQIASTFPGVQIVES